MAPPRHKHVREKAVSRPRRLLRVGLPSVAVLAVGTATVAAALPERAPAESASAAISLPAPQVDTTPVPVRVAPISRSEERVRLEAKPEPKGHLFATSVLNVRARPTEKSRRITSLEWAEKVAITGETRGEWVEVVVDELGYWVHSDFLAKRKPKPEPEAEPESETGAAEEAAPAASGVSMAPCADSSVESGLVSNAIAVHRAVCAAFPQVTSYGGLRADSGEHGTGQALDIMISGSTGWDIAEYVRANAGTLGVSEVIYSQKIWTVERGGDGWRYMEDRGSTTANHYDHVHVTVY